MVHDETVAAVTHPGAQRAGGHQRMEGLTIGKLVLRVGVHEKRLRSR